MTENTESIDRFLENLAVEGRYFQTSDFTLNSLKAREKLSEFQLPHPGLWLVKLVQAAVACGAKEVRIQFQKRLVRVEFDNKAGWTAGILLREVLSGTLPKDRTLLHLVTGLRGSATSLNEEVTWSCGGERVTLDSDGSSVSGEDDAEARFSVEARRPIRQIGLKKALTSSIFHLAKQTVDEHDAVQSRCWASPIPVLLDGRELDRGYGLIKAGHVESSPYETVMKWENSRQNAVTCCLALSPASLSHRVSLPYPLLAADAKVDDPYQVTQPVYKNSTFLRWPPGGSGGSQAVIAITATHAAESSLDFIFDGAMVERIPLSDLSLNETAVLGIKINSKPPVGIRIAVGVHARELDLSGFAVREADVPRLLAELRPAVDHLVETLTANRSKFIYIPFTRRYAKLMGVGLGGQLAYGLVLFKSAFVVPAIFGGVLMANLAIFHSVTYKAIEQFKQRWDEYVTSLVADTASDPP